LFQNDEDPIPYAQEPVKFEADRIPWQQEYASHSKILQFLCVMRLEE